MICAIIEMAISAGAIGRGEAASGEALQAAFVCLPAAQGADIERRRMQGPVERRIVELGIVGQRHQRRARVSLDLSQCFIRPAPVDAEAGEALDLGERSARINDQDIVAREACELRQRLCDMYRTDQNQPERRVEHLDEDRAGCRLETFAAVFG